VLSIMMAASDRSADRLGAANRAGRVRPIMNDVDYQKARESLPTVAIALMQNLSPSDVAALNVDLEALKGLDLPETAKALLLGLKLTNVVSTAVLAAAKDSLGACILVDAEDPPEQRTASQTDADAEGLLQAVPGLAEVGASRDRSAASAGLPQTPQTPSPHHKGGAAGGRGG
jgi:hypothetical protein